MKLTSLTATTVKKSNVNGLRSAHWLIDAEPYSRGSRSANESDEGRLKAALKRAVERDLAPQTLIDAILNGIRESR